MVGLRSFDCCSRPLPAVFLAKLLVLEGPVHMCELTVEQRRLRTGRRWLVDLLGIVTQHRQAVCADTLPQVWGHAHEHARRRAPFGLMDQLRGQLQAKRLRVCAYTAHEADLQLHIVAVQRTSRRRDGRAQGLPFGRGRRSQTAVPAPGHP